MIHIGVVLQKVMEKARILRLERDRRLVIARLAELERAIDGIEVEKRNAKAKS